MLIRRRTLCHVLSIAVAMSVAGCKKKDKDNQKDPGKTTAGKTTGETPDPPPKTEPKAPENNYQLEGTGPELYEKILVPPLFAPYAEDLIKRVELKEGEKVLDVATGTGIVARKAAAVVGEKGAVTGLDINPGMLAVAKEADAPDAPTIEWVEGDAQKLPFKDGTFDVVFCQQALQFIPDRAKAIKEMHRVLKPGGRIAVSIWRAPGENPYGEQFAKVVSAEVSPEAGKETTSPFGWDNQEELTKLMTDAGFKDPKVEAAEMKIAHEELNVFVINDLLAYPTTGKTLKEWDKPKKDALVAKILEALSTYKEGDVHNIPWSTNVGVGTK